MKVDFIELSKIPICNLIKASNCKIVPVAAYVMCATYESKVDRRRTRQKYKTNTEARKISQKTGR